MVSPFLWPALPRDAGSIGRTMNWDAEATDKRVTMKRFMILEILPDPWLAVLL